MSKAPIEAAIVELDNGPFFEVTLHALPRPGELIHLYSIVDARAHKQTDYFYEVVQVLHKLFDVPRDLRPDSRDALVSGSHSVAIFVRRTTSPLFDKISM
jgi:hypothetical protein